MTESERNLIPVVIVGFLMLVAGYSAAKRKGRAAGPWALACSLIAPLLIVLELLPSRRPYNDPERKTWPGLVEWAAIITGLLAMLIGALLTTPLKGTSQKTVINNSRYAPFDSLNKINEHQIPFPNKEKDTLSRLLRAEMLKIHSTDALQITTAEGSFSSLAKELEDSDICVDDQTYGYQVIKLHKCSEPSVHYMVTVLVNKDGTFSDPIYYGH